MGVFWAPLCTALRISTWASNAALLWAGASQAQVSLSPLKIEVQTNRGQAQGVINITNTSNETFRARVYAESFTYHQDKGFETLPSSPTDLRPYLQFSPRELVVPPGTTRRVRLNARLAANLPHGEYRTMIFTEPLKANNVNNGNGITTRIITRVGSAFFVRKGDVRPNLTVDSARWNGDAKKIQMLVRNTGKASAFASIKWILKQGETVIKTGEAPSAGIVPESDRNLILNREEKDELTLSPGTYQLSGELIWGENNKNTLPFKLDLTVLAAAAAASPEVRRKR
ncbi:MAG: P pilus assembly protein, chaperone PapD [Heteroscytonema crispum UTEX LB 1556]